MVDVRRTISLEFRADARQFLQDLREAAKLSKQVATTDRARIDAARAVAAEARAQAAQARAAAAEERAAAQQRINSLKEEQQATQTKSRAQREALQTEREEIRLDNERLRSQRQVNEAIREESEINQRRGPDLVNIAAGLSIVRNAYFAVFEVINQVNSAGQQFFDTFIRSNEELQKSAVSTAAGIASTNSVFDENGNEIENVTEAIQRLLPGLEQARQEVVALAAGIPGVTESDITPVFDVLAQNVGQLGVGIAEIPELAANATASLQTFGIPLFQARQELNALIRGQIDQNAALARQLNIRREDIQAAQEQGRLFEFLNERFEAAAAGAGLLSDLTENSLSNIQTTLDRITRTIGEPFLEPIQQGLQRVADFVSSIEEPVIRIFNQVRDQASRFLTPILDQLQVIRERFQPFFDALGPLFDALREQAAAIFTSLGEVVNSIINSGIIELVASGLATSLRIATEILTVTTRIGTVIGQSITPAITATIDVLRPVIGILQGILDLSNSISETLNTATFGLFDLFAGQDEEANEYLETIREIQERLENGGDINDLINDTDLDIDPTISPEFRFLEQSRIRRQLEEVTRQAAEGLELDAGPIFDELGDRIEAAFDPQTADSLIAGLEQVLGLTEDTNAALQRQELQLESLEQQRRNEERDRITAFQDELDIFAQQREFRQDAITALEEENRERNRQIEIAQGALQIEEALANLQLQRGAREIAALEQEQRRIDERIASLEEEGAANSTIRAARIEQEQIRQRLEAERQAQAEREFNLQQTQLQAQNAQIEAQRLLNQLKIDQLEVETEIARLNQEEQLATLNNQLEQTRREGGDPGRERELERSIANLEERLIDTINRQGGFDQQREDIDRAAREQQAALGLQEQAQVEAFIDNFAQLLVEGGDRVATRIDRDLSLTFDERREQLRQLAEERTGVTGNNSLAPDPSRAPTTQQVNAINVDDLLRQLELTGSASNRGLNQAGNREADAQTAQSILNQLERSGQAVFLGDVPQQRSPAETAVEQAAQSSANAQTQAELVTAIAQLREAVQAANSPDRVININDAGIVTANEATATAISTAASSLQRSLLQAQARPAAQESAFG